MKLHEVYYGHARSRYGDYSPDYDPPIDEETKQINYELERCCIGEGEWEWGKDGRINVKGEMWIPEDWQPSKMKPPIEFGVVAGQFCNDQGITTTTFEWLPHTCTGGVSLSLAKNLKSTHQLPRNINYHTLDLDMNVMNLLSLKRLKIKNLVLFGEGGWDHDGDPIPIGEMDVHEFQERLIEMGLSKQARL